MTYSKQFYNENTYVILELSKKKFKQNEKAFFGYLKKVTMN